LQTFSILFQDGENIKLNGINLSFSHRFVVSHFNPSRFKLRALKSALALQHLCHDLPS